MGIIQAPAVLPGQVGVIGAIKYMTTTVNLATLTTAGYLNSIDLAVNPVSASDVFGITYNFNLQTQSGTFDFFTVTIANGVITLVQDTSSGNVLLPVVSGDFAVFNGTTGQIKDAGYAPSNAAKTVVPMMNAAVTLNHVAQFADTAGTLKDGGVLGTAAAKAASDNGQASVASVSGATVTGNLAKFADTAGTVSDQGVAFKSVAGAAAAGGAAAQSFTDAFCTSGSCVVGNWNTQANAASVLTIVPGNGSFVVTSSADAGVGTFNYIITK